MLKLRTLFLGIALLSTGRIWATCTAGDLSCALATFLPAVALYHDDGHCEDGNLLAAVNSQTTPGYCRALADQIGTSVWGVRIGNQCYDISDLSFYDACIKYSGN